MSRHRDIRNLDYDEEYDEAYDDDVYGHSVEEYEYGVSPTMDQYMYSARSRDTNLGFGAYLPTDSDILEEEETAADTTDARTRHDSSTYEKPKLSDEDEVRLSSVMDELRNILGGEQYSDSEMTKTVLANNFDLNDSLNALLNKQSDGEAATTAATTATTAAVLPQRQQRQNRDGNVSYIIDSVGVRNVPEHIKKKSNKNLLLGEGSRVGYFHPPAFTAPSVCIFQDGQCERLPLHKFINEWYDDLMSKRKQKKKSKEEELKKEAECNQFIRESARKEALKKETFLYENSLSDSQDSILATSQEEEMQQSRDCQELVENVSLETKSMSKGANISDSETGMEALRIYSPLKSSNGSLDESSPSLALSHLSSQEKIPSSWDKPGSNSLFSLASSDLLSNKNGASLISRGGCSSLASLIDSNVVAPPGLSGLSSHLEMKSSKSGSSGLNIPLLPSSLGQGDEPMLSSSPKGLNFNIPAFPGGNNSPVLGVSPLLSNTNTPGINNPELPTTRIPSAIMNIPSLPGSNSQGFNIPAFPGSNSNSPSGFSIPAFPGSSKGDSKDLLGSSNSSSSGIIIPSLGGSKLSSSNKSDSSSVGGNSPSGVNIPPIPSGKPLSVGSGSQEPWELPECQNIASCSMAVTTNRNIDPVGTPAHNTSLLMSSSSSGLESEDINMLSSLAKNHFGSMLADVPSVPTFSSIPPLSQSSTELLLSSDKLQNMQVSSENSLGLSSLANLHLSKHTMPEVASISGKSEMEVDAESASGDDFFDSIEMEEIDLQSALRKPGSQPIKVKRNSPIFTDMDDFENYQFPYEHALYQPTPKSVFGEVMLKVMGKLSQRPKTRRLSKRTITVNFPIFKFDKPSPDDLVRVALENRDNPNWYKLLTKERQRKS